MECGNVELQPKRRPVENSEWIENFLKTHIFKQKDRTERIDTQKRKAAENELNEIKRKKPNFFTGEDPRYVLAKLMFDSNTIQNFFTKHKLDVKNKTHNFFPNLKSDNVFGIFHQFSEKEPSREIKRKAINDEDFVPPPELLENFQLLLEEEKYLFKEVSMKMQIIQQYSFEKESAEPSSMNACETELTLMSPESDKYKKVDQWISETFIQYRKCKSFKLVNVFLVKNENHEENFEPFASDPNRLLLFHGTNRINIPNILKNGLNVPTEMRRRELYNGLGIYFSDFSSEAGRFAGKDNKKGDTQTILLIYEVALGNTKITERKLGDSFTHSDLEEEFTSVKGLGKEFPSQKSPWNDSGLYYYHGDLSTLESSSEFATNEYVIYNEKRCILRYLAVVKYD